MTPKLIIILFVILSGIYSIILNIVKYRSANNPTPENVSDVYDTETYLKWKKYSAEHTTLSLISSIVSFIVSLVLLITNAYFAFASLFPNDLMLRFIAVILLEAVISTVIGVVEGYISTMKIEEKYGFNRSSLKTFIFDQIRSLMLSLVLSLAISSLLTLYLSIGDWIILLFAGVMFAFGLLISFLYPFFSRIGNKFVPLEEGELKDMLMELLNKHGYKVKAIEVMDASRRTTKLNAYITGFGKTKTIVLYDNLINAMTPEEISAVFAHELGHGLHKDVLKGQIFSLIQFFVMAAIACVCVREPSLHTDFGFTDVNFGFAYILIGVILGLVQPFLALFSNARSRKAEYRADRQAVKEGYGKPMISALKKLARDNFAHLSPSKINVLLDYSHPPLADRIAAVQKELDKISEE
ncbi:MAG: M48 family metallopeptidase [Clostridia bacterium]|nr:M48 family metallopeptidase [Clostridia bacterium]